MDKHMLLGRRCLKFGGFLRTLHGPGVPWLGLRNLSRHCGRLVVEQIGGQGLLEPGGRGIVWETGRGCHFQEWWRRRWPVGTPTVQSTHKYNEDLYF